MGPREDREQMAAQRMEPGGTECNEERAVAPHEQPDGSEHANRISEMFEAIQGNDDVDLFRGPSREVTALRQLVRLGVTPGDVQDVGPDVDADHSGRSMRRDIDGVRAEDATEIHHYLVPDVVPNLAAEQCLQLA